MKIRDISLIEVMCAITAVVAGALVIGCGKTAEPAEQHVHSHKVGIIKPDPELYDTQVYEFCWKGQQYTQFGNGNWQWGTLSLDASGKPIACLTDAEIDHGG